MVQTLMSILRHSYSTNESTAGKKEKGKVEEKGTSSSSAGCKVINQESFTVVEHRRQKLIVDIKFLCNNILISLRYFYCRIAFLSECGHELL